MHEKEIMKMCDENMFSLEFLSSQLKTFVPKAETKGLSVKESGHNGVRNEGASGDKDSRVTLIDDSIAEVEVEEEEEEAGSSDEEAEEVVEVKEDLMTYQLDEVDGDESEEEIVKVDLNIKKKKKKKESVTEINQDENDITITEDIVEVDTNIKKKKKKKKLVTGSIHDENDITITVLPVTTDISEKKKKKRKQKDVEGDSV